MKYYNADLHLHGKHAGGVSKNMELPLMAQQAALKGLHMLGTGDVLHAKWLEHVKGNLVEEENGVYRHKNFEMNFIIQTEVECCSRVHHVILLPDIASAESLREKMLPHGKLDSEGFGRPKLHIDAEFISQKVEECGGIMGPAHAFTPYFSVYAHFNDPRELYKGMSDKIFFLELGLSADSAIADKIKRNWDYSFITTSDAHSPWPFRLGREFTRFKLNKPSFEEIKKALKDRSGEKISLNVGLDPREGKYHATACSSCYTKYSEKQAETFKWKCPQCGKPVKKGAKGRIIELAEFTEEKHPSFRPPYLHIIPLAEIIQIALGKKNPSCGAVQEKWLAMIDRFGSEIKVLIDADIGEIREVDERIGESIDSFRKGFVAYKEGGGGKYGQPFICKNREETEKAFKRISEEEEREKDFSKQKTLAEF